MMHVDFSRPEARRHRQVSSKEASVAVNGKGSQLAGRGNVVNVKPSGQSAWGWQSKHCRNWYLGSIVFHSLRK